MEQVSPQPWNILYIDDDEEDLLITRAMLAQMQGRKVRLEWAATFDEACEKLSRGSTPDADKAPYDAVLVDYDLGQHTGIQIIAAYAPTYPAPLILFTGRGSAEVDREALQAGATMYLTKNEANPLLLERIIRYAIERKQTDRALYESQDRFRRMIEVAPDAVFVQTGGTFAYLNPAALRFFGAERLEQMRGRAVIDFVDAPDSEAVKARIEQLNRQREPAPAREEGFLRLDGSRVDTETLATPITYEGQPGVLVIMRDITERVRRQKNADFLAEISDALARLSTPREILETAGDKIFAFFGSSRVSFCEVDLADNCARILYEQTIAGLPHSPAQISLSDFMDDAFLRDAQKGQVVTVNDHASDPRTLRLTERYQAYGVAAQLLAASWSTKNRNFILSVQKSAPHAWRQDEIELANGLVARIHPALEKALAQEALREGNEALQRAQVDLANERNRLLAVLEALPVGVAIVGEDGAMLLANDAYEEIWGSPRPSVQSFEDASAYIAWWAETGKPLQADEWASSQAVQRGEAVVGQYLRLQRFDGSVIYVLNSASPVRDVKGKVVAAVVAIQDITDRVLAQQSRDESEQRLRATLSAVPLLVYECDRDLRYTWVMNPLRGFRVEDVLGKRDDEILPEQAAQELVDVKRQSIETGQGLVREITVPHDGQPFMYILAVEPLRDAGGEVSGLICSSLDITAQRKTQMAQAQQDEEHRLSLLAAAERQQQILDRLEKSEQKFSIIFHKAPYIASLTSPADGRLVDVNDAWERAFGYTREEAVGRTVAELNTRPDDAIRKRMFAQFVENGYLREVEVEMTTRSGELRAFLINLDMVEIGGEQFVLNTARDITARRQADQALRESETRFRALADGTPLMIWVTDSSGNIVFINQAYSDFFGVTREEVQTRGWRMLVHPDDGRYVEGFLQAARERRPYQSRTRVRHADGEWHWIESYGQPRFSEAGEFLGMAGSSVDITEQKRAEEERLGLLADLDRQKALLETLVDDVSQMVWMTDEQGSIIWMNRRGIDFTGKMPEEMGEFNWEQAQHPDFREWVTASYLDAIATGSPWEVVAPLRGNDGEFRWFLTRATPVQDASGRITGWLATSTDITELRGLQEENREQKELLERLVNAAPVGVAFLNGPEHVYTLVNPAYERISRGKGRMIGRTVAEMWPEIMDQVKPQMDAVYRDGISFSVVDAPLTVIRNGVPELNYFTYTFTPITAAGGHIQGIMILAIEKTEEVHNREAIEAHSARLNAILESLPVGVWISDAKGRLLQKNLQADRIWSGEGPLLKSVEEYDAYAAWDPETGEKLMSEDYPMALALRESRHVDARELRIRRFDGTEGYVLVSAEVVRDTDGNTLGAVGVNVDITGRKQTEKQLQHYAEELERSNQALQDFAAIAGHDLQEPLRKIILFGQMLNEQYAAHLQDDGKDYIARMTSAANRMNAMLASLLAYSRVNTQGEPFQAVDLNRVVAEVLDDLEARVLETGGEVKAGQLPAVYADPVQMRQLIQNLLGNALKFHRPGVSSEVRIHGRALENGQVEIVVSDNGIGFDARKAALLFQPFRRMHARSDYPGSGMGLAICKKIVERHGGEIHAESVPGQGSTFRVVLPAALRS